MISSSLTTPGTDLGWKRNIEAWAAFAEVNSIGSHNVTSDRLANRDASPLTISRTTFSTAGTVTFNHG